MPTSMTNPFPAWAESGASPVSGKVWNNDEPVNEKFLDFIWDQLNTFWGDVVSEVDTDFIRTDGSTSMSTDLDMANNTFTNLGLGTEPVVDKLFERPMPSLSNITTANESETLEGFQNAFDNPAWAGPSYRQVSAGAIGSQAYDGAVVTENGKVIFIPSNASNFGIFDPETETFSTGAANPNPGNNTFSGGVLLPDGRIMCVPSNHANVGLYDPATDTYTDGPAHGQGTVGVFTSAAQVADGRVVLCPNDATNVGLFDPSNDTYSDGPVWDPADGLHLSATTMTDGRVLFVAWTAASFWVFDPDGDTLTETATNPDGPLWGATPVPDGRVICAPYNADQPVAYDPATDTVTELGFFTDDGKDFAGACLTPNGMVQFITWSSSLHTYYDPVNDTIVEYESSTLVTGAGRGGAMTPQGKVISAPYGSTEIQVHDHYAMTDHPHINATHPLVNQCGG